MSAPVDALAVLRAAVGDAVMARAARFKPEHAIKLEREGFAAVEAVAELIEKSAAALHYMRLHRYADQAWADDLAEALARVQGGRDHG